MPISKTTATIAGEASTALLSLTQYGVRAKIEIPTKSAITSTHRASSGTTRTLTLTSAHGMVADDLFLFGGFGNANYNTSGYCQIGKVVSVPAANKLTFTHPSSLTETETADTAGGIIRLGFKTLRLGVRWAFPRASTWNMSGERFGFGLSQGANAVGSASCSLFTGWVNNYNLTYGAGPPAGLTIANSSWQSYQKVNSNWSNPFDGTSTSFKYAASRLNPFINCFDCVFLEYAGNVRPLLYARNGISSGYTRQSLLDVLRSPVNLNTTDTFSGVTLAYFQMFLINSGSSWANYASGADLYLEAFCRDASQAMEIYDIGYSYF